MSDLSRVEQLLRNALGEDIYEVTPQSRVEILLAQLNELIEGISASVDPEELTPIVTAWLADNIHDGAVVDTSLSVAGAAAESKKTGDEISQLKEDLNVVSEGLDDEIARARAEEARIEALFTQPVEDAVSEWLDDHPEATTTVENGSLTLNKFKSGELPFVTPEQFGAKGDGIVDDTVAIQNAFDSDYAVIFGNGKTYLTSDTLTISNSIMIDLNNSEIKSTTRDGASYVLYVNNCSNVVIKNGAVTGDRLTHTNGTDNCHCIRLQSSNNVLLSNLKLSGAYADGLLISNCQNVLVNDIESFSNGRNNISVLSGNNLFFNNIYSHDCVGSVAPGHGFTIEPWYDGQDITNVNINNLYSVNNKGNGLEISLYHEFDCSISINNVYLINNDNYGLGVAGCPDVSGFVKINNVFIDGSNISFADVCSDTFELYVDNVVMQNTVAYGGGLWGSAIFLFDNHNTDIPFKNVFINNVLIRGGNHVYLSYCKINTTPCVNVVISNLKVIQGSAQIVSVDGVIYKNVPMHSVSRSSNLKLNNFIYTHIYTSAGLNLGDGYNKDQEIYIENTGDSDILIETSNNNLGPKNVYIPPKSSMICKRTGEGFWELTPATWWVYVPANSTLEIDINNIKEIQITRSTLNELYYVRYGTVLNVLENNSLGVSVSVSNNTIVFTNTTGGNAKIFIR